MDFEKIKYLGVGREKDTLRKKREKARRCPRQRRCRGGATSIAGGEKGSCDHFLDKEQRRCTGSV